MPAIRPCLIVGLGNPGERYRQTRHNAGFMVMDHLAEKQGVVFDRNKFNADFGRGNIGEIPVIFAKPLAFMNLSGPAVQKLMQFFRITGEDLLVVHDDIDLPFGKIKIKEKGDYKHCR